MSPFDREPTMETMISQAERTAVNNSPATSIVEPKPPLPPSVRMDFYYPADDFRHYRSDGDTQTVVEDPMLRQTFSRQLGEDPNEADDKGNKDLIDTLDDDEDPMKWSMARKYFQTMLSAVSTFVVTFASSSFSVGTAEVASKFHVSVEVSTLGTALFVLGFAFGPLLFAPISERYGRKVPMLAGYLLFGIFQIPVAVARNLETIMLGRFFSGFFASAPLAIIGGCLADFWDAKNRGAAVVFFAMATFGGPTFGPIIGGFIVNSYLGWRWTVWVTFFMAMLMFVLQVFLFKETYRPYLLQQKAKRLRFETHNWALHAPLDEKRTDMNTVISVWLARPLKMLFTEPMIFLVSLYVSFVYGLLYLLFSAYPIEYRILRGWNSGVASLPFVGIFVGVLIGCCIIFAFLPRYTRKMAANGGRPVPEERFIPMMLGGIIFPIGLFWFAWTSKANGVDTWVPSVLSGLCTGAGIVIIFLQTLTFLIDAYLMFANSAIAANAFARGLMGAGFPMFARSMFVNLGTPWAASTLGFISIAFIPVPMLFYVFGKRLRQASNFAQS